jgi:hypothetical protein
MLIAVIALIVLAATFVAGAVYGRSAEAKSIALALRIAAYGRIEVQDALACIRKVEDAYLTRLKNWL